MKSTRTLAQILVALAVIVLAAVLGLEVGQEPSISEADVEPARTADVELLEGYRDLDEPAAVGSSVVTTTADFPLAAEYRPRGVFLGAAEIFRREPIDAAWATATESRLFEALTSVPTGANMIQAECRTTQCRVEILNDICPISGTNFEEQGLQFATVAALVEEATDYRTTATCMERPIKGMVINVYRTNP